jgi:hypothetical protein
MLPRSLNSVARRRLLLLLLVVDVIMSHFLLHAMTRLLLPMCLFCFFTLPLMNRRAPPSCIRTDHYNPRSLL